MLGLGLQRWCWCVLLLGCEAAANDEPEEVWIVDHHLEMFCPDEGGWFAPRVQIEGKEGFHFAAHGLADFTFEWGVRSRIVPRIAEEPGMWEKFGVEEILDQERVPAGTDFAISWGCFYSTGFDGSAVTMNGQRFPCESEAACAALDPAAVGGPCLH